jgi:hypothetical protein
VPENAETMKEFKTNQRQPRSATSFCSEGKMMHKNAKCLFCLFSAFLAAHNAAGAPTVREKA